MPLCASKAWSNFTRSSATVFRFSSIVVTQPVPIEGNTRVTVAELGNIASGTIPTQIARAIEAGDVARGDQLPAPSLLIANA